MGISLFVFFTSLPLILFSIILVFFKFPPNNLKNLKIILIFLFGLVIGLIPELCLNRIYGFNRFTLGDFRSEFHQPSSEFFKRFFVLIFYSIPDFLIPISTPFVIYLSFFIGFVILYFVLLSFLTGNKNKILALYFLFYIFLFSLTSFPLKGEHYSFEDVHRYTFPLYLPIILLLLSSYTFFEGRHLDKLKIFSLIFLISLLIIQIYTIFFTIKNFYIIPDVNSLLRNYCYYDFMFHGPNINKLFSEESSKKLPIQEKATSACENLGDYNYYNCYKAIGKITMMNAQDSSLAIQYCSNFSKPFNDYCEEGVFEEMGYESNSHNLSVGFFVEPVLIGEEIQFLDGIEVVRMFGINPEDIEIIPSCKSSNKKDKPYYCYSVLPSSLARYKWFCVNNTDFLELCSKIRPPYTDYCFIGIGRMTINTFSLVNIKEGYCDSFPKNVKNFCYVGMGREIGSYYDDITQAFDFCNTFRNYIKEEFCYKGIGWSLGEKFRHNLDLAYKYCNDLSNETSREYCYNGIKERILLVN